MISFCRSFQSIETENRRKREDSGYQNCDQVENSTSILFVTNPGYDMVMMNEIGGEDDAAPAMIDALTRDDLLDFAKQIADGMVQYRH